MTPADGCILLDKPAGISSFKALGPVKRALAVNKVGHTGTLDPFASGLMVVLCGRLTKLASQLSGLDKTYEATLRFGEETATLDPEGDVVANGDIPSLDTISARIPAFVGEISQQPPAYSAVHVKGKRAYERVRDGESIDLPARSVCVRSLDILGYTPPDLTVRMTVSSGTYIRSIARDLGRACGSVAHVSSLRRVSVADWNVADSVAPEDFDRNRDLISASETVLRIPNLPAVIVNDSAVKRICNGIPFRAGWIERRLDRESRSIEGLEGDIALFDGSWDLLGIVTHVDGTFKYRFVRPKA